MCLNFCHYNLLPKVDSFFLKSSRLVHRSRTLSFRTPCSQIPLSSWGQFHQHSMSSFYACRSQKHKTAAWLDSLFALLVSAHVKAAYTMLVKLTPGVGVLRFGLSGLGLQSLLSFCVLRSKAKQWCKLNLYFSDEIEISKQNHLPCMSNWKKTKCQKFSWISPPCSLSLSLPLHLCFFPAAPCHLVSTLKQTVFTFQLNVVV